MGVGVGVAVGWGVGVSVGTGVAVGGTGVGVDVGIDVGVGVAVGTGVLGGAGLTSTVAFRAVPLCTPPIIHSAVTVAGEPAVPTPLTLVEYGLAVSNVGETETTAALSVEKSTSSTVPPLCTSVTSQFTLCPTVTESDVGPDNVQSGVGVGVAVGGTGVFVGVGVDVTVGVGVGILVGVDVGVGVDVAVGIGVLVGVGVEDGGIGVDVGVGVAVGAATKVAGVDPVPLDTPEIKHEALKVVDPGGPEPGETVVVY